MNLRLHYPPTCEHMHDHAAVAVRSAADISRVDLDYQVASLADVDGILGRFHDDGIRSEQVAETLFAFGAYIGEVMVRRAGGLWVGLPPGNPLGAWPMIKLSSETLANPIGKAFKRVDLGDTENLPYFYRVFVKRPA